MEGRGVGVEPLSTVKLLTLERLTLELLPVLPAVPPFVEAIHEALG